MQSPPNNLFPSSGFFTIGDRDHIQTMWREIQWLLCPNLDISTQLAAFGVISHRHRLHPTSAQVHFPLHNCCWTSASEELVAMDSSWLCHFLEKSGTAVARRNSDFCCCKKELRFLAKSVSQLLSSRQRAGVCLQWLTVTFSPVLVLIK